MCESLGSDFVINYKHTNTKEAFIKKVMEFTNNKGVDYLLDPVFE